MSARQQPLIRVDKQKLDVAKARAQAAIARELVAIGYDKDLSTYGYFFGDGCQSIIYVDLGVERLATMAARYKPVPINDLLTTKVFANVFTAFSTSNGARNLRLETYRKLRGKDEPSLEKAVKKLCKHLNGLAVDTAMNSLLSQGVENPRAGQRGL